MDTFVDSTFVKGYNFCISFWVKYKLTTIEKNNFDRQNLGGYFVNNPFGISYLKGYNVCISF